MFKGEYRAIDLVYNGKAINSNQEPYAKDYIIGSDCTFWQVLDYLEKIKSNGAHGSLQITYFDSNGREWGSRDIFKYETDLNKLVCGKMNREEAMKYINKKFEGFR